MRQFIVFSLFVSLSFLYIVAVSPHFAVAITNFWILNGTVRDGGSCSPIAGAIISSPYNENATNVSNSKGQYRLILGFGNWTVTAYKPGYNRASYNTPYLTIGGFNYNFSLLKPNETPYNCSISGYPVHIVNVTTTINVTTTATMPIVKQSPQGNNNLIAGVIILVAAAGAIYFLRRKQDTEPITHPTTKTPKEPEPESPPNPTIFPEAPRPPTIIKKPIEKVPKPPGRKPGKAKSPLPKPEPQKPVIVAQTYSKNAVCGAHNCDKRAVQECRFCHKAFCKEHADPLISTTFKYMQSLNPGSDYKKWKKYNDDWQRKDGHPCVPYTEWWNAQN